MLVAPLSTSNTYVHIAVGEIAEEAVRELEVVKALPLFSAGGHRVRGHWKVRNSLRLTLGVVSTGFVSVAGGYFGLPG